ncbi:MAG: hypothetical protein SOT46_06585 [Treponema sp.]|nr:hypothetical protein [Spirochaetia bacterium]MDY2840023.1 hypothetical protein [Treponema sp.]MDY5124299.1 hypothetical protein [Treponema sp.]
MGNLKRLVLIFVIALMPVLVFAKQISFQVVQHDESSKAVTEQSLVIEDVVLNSFFEKGYIVTNSATVVSEEPENEKLYKTGLKDAFEGYSDLFVQINLFYIYNPENKKNNSSLNKINWTVTDTKTGKQIDSESINDIKPFANNKEMNNFTAVLVNEISKSILVKKN